MIATLARASVEGALLVALVWLLARLLHLSPATRTVLWWCAAAKFVIALAWMAPIEVPVLPAPAPATAAVVHRVSTAGVSEGNGAALSRRRRAPAPGPGLAASLANGLREWSSFAVIGWTVGLAAAVFVGVRRWRETSRMLRESTAASDAIQAQATELASCLGLRTVPEVRVSASAETPFVMGLLRPVVLLPASRLDALTDEQRRMVICHELAHLKRADLWLGCVPALAERIFFFHPLAHVASREYALAREAACDASVMRTLGAAPQEYGRLLLALGVSPSRSGLTAAGAAWSFQNLKRRIAMLQDISVRSTGSKLLTAAIIGLAVVALVPLKLVARPARSQAAPGAASSLAAVERESADVQATKAAQPQKADRGRDDKRSMRFVLLSEDGSRTTAGPFEAEDLRRAERQRRDGEPLLWFSYDGREYVVRDVEVLRQARSLWHDVYRPNFDADSMREMAEAVQSLKIDELVEQGARIAQSAVDSAMLADQAQLIAEQGQQAAQFGLVVADQALRALTQGGLAGLDMKLEQQLGSLDKLDFDKLEMDKHLRSLEKLSDDMHEDVEHQVRELEHRLKGDLDSQMKHLHERLGVLEEPMKHFGGDQWKDFGHQMEHLGRSVEEAARNASEQMRDLIERAIANGQARPIR